MKKRLLYIVLVLVSVLFFTSILTTDGARLQNSTPIRENYNFAGVTKAVAWKEVIADDSTWNGKIRSYTTNPQYNIGTIGWTWWQVSELCNGQFVDYTTYPGWAAYGAHDLYNFSVQAIDSCYGYHYGNVQGTHDFKHNGSEWRPSFFYAERIDGN